MASAKGLLGRGRLVEPVSGPGPACVCVHAPSLPRAQPGMSNDGPKSCLGCVGSYTVPALGTADGICRRAEWTVPIVFIMAGRLYSFGKKKKNHTAAFTSEIAGNAVLPSWHRVTAFSALICKAGPLQTCEEAFFVPVAWN